MIRRFGETVKAGQRYRRRPGVYAVLMDGDAVLTTFQEAPIPEFQLPGGGIDKGEQPIAALHREVFEETGWKIAVTRHLGTFRRFTYMPEYDMWAEKLCTVYLALPVRRLGPPSEAGHRAVWMPARAGLDLLGYTTQASFLLNAGITGLLQAYDPNDIRTYLPLASATQKLLSPAEMGELFKAIAFGKGFDAPLQGFATGDRSRAL